MRLEMSGICGTEGRRTAVSTVRPLSRSFPQALANRQPPHICIGFGSSVTNGAVGVQVTGKQGRGWNYPCDTGLRVEDYV